MAKRKVIRRACPADLLDAIYKAEGWTRREGENRTKRVKALYTITVSHRAGVYLATPKDQPDQ